MHEYGISYEGKFDYKGHWTDMSWVGPYESKQSAFDALVEQFAKMLEWYKPEQMRTYVRQCQE